MRQKNKIAALALSSAMLVSLLATGAVAAPQGVVAETKSETVYVQTDSEGGVKDITVRTELGTQAGSGKIADYSTLTGIKNIKGEEKFTQEKDGTILWENLGANIQYEGESDKKQDLPISVEVSYYLDGKKMEPDEIVGKSGQVRVCYKYKNNTLETVTADGQEMQVPVPFTVFTSVFLPSDTFTNIEIKNGGYSVEFGDQQVLIGFSIPGMGDTLKLQANELTKGLKIPDSLEFTADVTNFELPVCTSSASTGALQKLDLSQLETSDDLMESINQLLNASDQLVRGAAELSNGMGTLKIGIYQYTSEVSKGVSKVESGADELMSNLDALEKKKNQMKSEANELIDYLETVQKKLNHFNIPTSENFDAESVAAAASALETDANALLKAIDATQEELSSVSTFAETAVQLVNRVAGEVGSQLDAVDLQAVETSANEKARAQAEQAADAALADTSLTDEEKVQIKQKLVNNIDVSGVTSEAQQHIVVAQMLLSQMEELKVPEITVNIDEITALLEDMRVQLETLQSFAEPLTELDATLDEANAFLNEVKGDADMLRQKSNKLISGLSFADATIVKARRYATELNSMVAKLEAGNSKLKNGADQLADGAEKLSDGMQQFDEEGMQAIEDFTENSLQGVITRFKAMQVADGQYNNFGGITEETEGTVRFIIATDGVEIEKSAE